MGLREPNGEVIEARIPAGIKDGQSVRVRGKGQPGAAGNGDLIVKVSVKPHPFFVREDNNIRIHVPVTFAEAALGGQIEVPTLTGETVKVKVPAGTRSGRTLRLKERGVHTAKATGDLLVTIDVVVPRNLNASGAGHQGLRRRHRRRGPARRARRQGDALGPGRPRNRDTDQGGEGMDIDRYAPIFVISVAAELAEMHPQTLRQYDRLGLVSPPRRAASAPLLASATSNMLREVQRLSKDGVSLEGIRRILQLENQVAALRPPPSGSLANSWSANAPTGAGSAWAGCSPPAPPARWSRWPGASARGPAARPLWSGVRRSSGRAEGGEC